MDALAIDDAIRRANGTAARTVGVPHELHRAHGATSPVRRGTAVMQLNAHFIPQRSAVPSHGHPLFEGIFDSSYTQAGDYLVGTWTYFIASQMPLQPVVCVRTTRLLSFARAVSQAGSGLGTYGGMVRAGVQPLLEAWPASVIAGGSGLDRGGLPADASLPGMSVLLPATDAVILRTGDLVTDDLERAGVVAAAELSEHGWKLFVKQAAT